MVLARNLPLNKQKAVPLEYLIKNKDLMYDIGPLKKM